MQVCSTHSEIAETAQIIHRMIHKLVRLHIFSKSEHALVTRFVSLDQKSSMAGRLWVPPGAPPATAW
jgi:hypothetical protein